MKALILGEESGTVDSSQSNALGYYKGMFLGIARLHEKLSEYVETDTYILTDEFGVIKGSDDVRDLDGERYEIEVVVSAFQDADIVVILLSKDRFESAFGSRWGGVVEAATSDSVWCIGTSPSILRKYDFDELEERTKELFVYKRVGVAPLDNETRGTLLDYVSDFKHSSER